MINLPEKQKAFTLVEIVVVMGLLVLMLVGLMALFTSHNKIYNYETALIKATGSARTVMNEISKHALQGYRVVASQTVNGTAYTSSSTTVIFQIPTFNSSGTAIANTYDYAAFSLSGNTLTEDFQSGAGGTKPSITKALSSSVSALTITYDNATWTAVKKVSVDLTTSETYRAQTITQRLNEQYRLRNY